MKISVMTEDALLFSKSNAKMFYDHMFVSLESAESFYGNDEVRFTSEVEFKDFDLVTDNDNPSNTDLQNIQIIYNALRDLNETQASEERLWVALSLFEYSDYMENRWKPDSVNKFLNRYFFNYPDRRSLFRHGLSRLWWIGKLTYDQTRDNPYELTEYACRDQDYLESIFGRNLSSNKNIVKAIIQSLINYEKQGHHVNRDIVRKLSIYFNAVGGVCILDSLEYDELLEMSKEFLKSIDLEAA